ncbi:hypothetical protein HK098_003863 [Nowakowskiella sp. JEL0407]|nr:hypothetical protein HK098_003863 [Nowakowskiella sp. JEL0407]
MASLSRIGPGISPLPTFRLASSSISAAPSVDLSPDASPSGIPSIQSSLASTTSSLSTSSSNLTICSPELGFYTAVSVFVGGNSNNCVALCPFQRKEDVNALDLAFFQKPANGCFYGKLNGSAQRFYYIKNFGIFTECPAACASAFASMIPVNLNCESRTPQPSPTWRNNGGTDDTEYSKEILAGTLISIAVVVIGIAMYFIIRQRYWRNKARNCSYKEDPLIIEDDPSNKDSSSTVMIAATNDLDIPLSQNTVLMA